MKKYISPKSPRKQRRKVWTRPEHLCRKSVRCRLDDALREEYGTRSLLVRRGDLVRIMRGQFRDTEAKVVRVDHKASRVYVDSATITKIDGKEAKIPIHPSNLMLVKLELDDDRKKRLQKKMIKTAEARE